MALYVIRFLVQRVVQVSALLSRSVFRQYIICQTIRYWIRRCSFIEDLTYSVEHLQRLTICFWSVSHNFSWWCFERGWAGKSFLRCRYLPLPLLFFTYAFLPCFFLFGSLLFLPAKARLQKTISLLPAKASIARSLDFCCSVCRQTGKGRQSKFALAFAFFAFAMPNPGSEKLSQRQ